MFYQVISRNNDVNGNPYRLIMVYEACGDYPILRELYEAQSSRPNICYELDKEYYGVLPEMHLTPRAYNALKKEWMKKGFALQLSH